MGQEKANGALSDDEPYFGDLIRETRWNLNISLGKLAYLSGVSRSMVCAIEGHKRLPSPETARELARVLNLDPDRLVLALLNAQMPSGFRVIDRNGNAYPCRFPALYPRTKETA